MTIALAIAPITLTILCGYCLRRTGAVPHSNWSGIETLSFRLLIPVILIKSIALSELVLSDFGGMIIITILALGLAGASVFLLRIFQSRETLPNPDFTTLFQTTTRWNAFIALAAAELLIGPPALALIAAAMAVLIPLINIANIVVLAQFGAAKTTAAGVLKAVAKNPLVQACIIGILINLSGVQLPATIVQTLDLIGRAALGVGLLAVGAAINAERLFRYSPQVVLGVLFRLALCPALFIALAHLAGLAQIETIAGLLVLSVPAASNGYIIAKQMGGNAELYADILTWQTVLSLLVLPLLIRIVMTL